MHGAWPSDSETGEKSDGVVLDGRVAVLGSHRSLERVRNQRDVLVCHVRIERKSHDPLGDLVGPRERSPRLSLPVQRETVDRRIVDARLDPLACSCARTASLETPAGSSATAR